MKKFLKWAIIVIVVLFVGLMALGMLVDANKTPEQRAAETAAREQQRTEAAAAREQAKADAAASKERAKAEAEQKKLDEERAALDALPQVTVAELAKAYEENTVAADQKFKGKRYRVSGTVDSINTDLMGDPYVSLRAGLFIEPQFSFSQAHLEVIGTLKKGQTVNLVCTGRGDVGKTPMSKDCQVL
ncbi:TPA: hypothetical protein ACGCGJ_001000 [Stenotrophomonas maltophilia]|jgi:hypothetical protein|uniref:tRNA_anti-like n=1 Tax=Stenotrophomonas maltophilia TaxID=40324 RepID=A0A2W6GKT6_STEMA|nr:MULTISPECIES: hypothetical protein [Stenotrophomonas]EKT4066866.1 hypothetical protein [Stenotrophomonas maltophilia]EMB2829948.1 hypothetical protein [Stenotrophomonas maltophilia]KIS40405.1 hypothetical protein WJ66_01017 [Stenotrophomonas maltophilia WJ66]MBH1451058.1 hypothetical protein [Stenotrophomonas maltophilia]MBH1565857.1 hypothetical protein [Stenotrophomonas maltophilia]